MTISGLRVIIPIFLMIAPSSVLGQVPSSEEPGRQSQRFFQTETVDVRRGGTISLPGSVALEGAEGISLFLSDVRFEGSTVYSQDVLDEFASDLVGEQISLAEIYSIAQQITGLYGQDGYVLSRAIIPPQELDPNGAVVTIKIVEVYIDRVVWPESLDRYQDFFSEYAEKIKSDRPANINTVMRYLLLAGDLPGIDVTSRFQASEDNPNASTLIVDVTEKAVDVFARLDNRGTEARGPVQYLTSVTLNNMLGLHESVSVSYGGVIVPSELQHIAVNVSKVLNSEGLTAFASLSGSKGAPGTPALQALQFTSRSLNVAVGLNFPVIRSRDENLTVKGVVFASNSYGEMLGVPSSEDMLRGVRIGADYVLADEFDGINQLSVQFSQGILGLGSSVNTNPLASRENGRVDFSKIDFSASRDQQLGNGFSIYGVLQGQVALTPLLSPEECGYGGSAIGRGFDASELTGDSCLSVLAEIRFNPDLPDNPFSLTQLYAFADYGKVYRLAPTLGTPTTDEGASVGLGVRIGNDNFTADFSAVKPIFGRVDQDWRFFGVLGTSF